MTFENRVQRYNFFLIYAISWKKLEKIGKNWNGQTGSIEPYLSSVGTIHRLGIAVVKDAIEILIVIAHEDGIDDLLARDVLNLSAREVETVGKNR